MKKIYVAGKYTGKTYSEIDDNIYKAEQISIKLIQKGWNVFTPHKIYSHYERYEGVGNFDYHLWLKMDIEWMLLCDAVIFMNEWQNSPGAMKEHRIAVDNNKKIFYEAQEIPSVDVLEE